MHLPSLATLTLAACAIGSGASSDPTPARGASVAAPAADETAAAFDHTHAAWTRVLAGTVRGDRFDYAALARDPAPLKRYLDALHAVTPEELAGWTREQRYAFWINAYNAHVVQKVVERYPIESIRDLDKALGLKSVFDQAWIPMEALHPTRPGSKLSLNDVENEILRERFQDARVHAAINCASLGCPPLLAEAFVPERLEAQLEQQMRAFVLDRERNRFDREKGVAQVSKIFEWFSGDFERDAGSVRDWLIRFSPPEDAAFLRGAKIRHQDYSWKLNDAADGG